MKINRHNYEAFLLDKLEGRLSVEEEQELENFLLLNPDCSSELSETEPWTLEAAKIPYQNTSLLKKELPDSTSVLEEHNFGLFSIARLEGDLDSEQIRAHQVMLEADDQKELQWQQWQQTRLEAEPVLFQRKDRLLQKKDSNYRMVWISVISAAAAIALLFVLFRAEPEQPQQESYSQGASPEAEIQLEGMEADPPVHQQKDPVRSNKPIHLTESVHTTEPINTSDPVSMPEEMHEESLKALPLAFSAQRFNNSSMARGAVPDQIKALDIAPVPVHLSSLSLAQVSEIGVQEVIEEYVEEKDFSLWKVADAGIKGINKLAGSDISLLASRDEEGEVSGFQLKSKRFSLSRPIDREE